MWASAQWNYWQQKADYKINVNLNAATHQYTGSETIQYENNSPDTLKRLYFHLYNNAFQPGSMMDVRSRTIVDPDSRVGDRIYHLTPAEQGYLHVHNLKVNGEPTKTDEQGTILEVKLEKPILPGKKATMELSYEAQEPLQVRRSGRDNAEGIDYSMSQWYPKLCEYDYMGWDATPYVGREFYGVWGNFDVTIKLDSAYMVAATGLLQNADEIGKGYAQLEHPQKSKETTWHFVANRVHDFVWAADPDYVHQTIQVPNGPLVHFFYQPDSDYAQQWRRIQPYVSQLFTLASKNFGKYPFPTYSVIQGGDGGMEYPMATLVTGNRKFGSLLGTIAHEMMHSWYYFVLATDESRYPWMDEGFTTFASTVLMNDLFPNPNKPNALINSYYSYYNIVDEKKEEPMTLQADHFTTNEAYEISSYSKGSIFLSQLGYVVGDSMLYKGLRRYFHDWQFKHPTPANFIHEMELTTGMQLKWYLNEMTSTTQTVDYGIRQVKGTKDSTEVVLEKVGDLAMPLDIIVEFLDGSKEYDYIPMRLMRGAKHEKVEGLTAIQHKDWPWTNPYYFFSISRPVSDIARIIIDPTMRLADINPQNNFVNFKKGENYYLAPNQEDQQK